MADEHLKVQGTRERIWLTKLDHSTDPPRVVEETFLENGVVRQRVQYGARDGRHLHLADRVFVPSPLNTPSGPLAHDVRTTGLLACRPKVALVGASTGRDRAPVDDPEWDVWALNLVAPIDSVGRLRADRWFDLHQRVAQSADDLRWIAKCPVPIHVPDDLLDAGPNCLRYPVELVEARYGGYWSCTFAYQIALALLLGVQEIGLFGVELSEGTRRERTVEWANVSWWMGYAEGHGVVFHLPEGTRLGQSRYRYGLEYRAELDDVAEYVRGFPGMPANEVPVAVPWTVEGE